jgi:hypothetical protein
LVIFKERSFYETNAAFDVLLFVPGQQECFGAEEKNVQGKSG